jgi:hypothetical protein
MSMRAAYCNPGEKIQWYTVSWPADSLSWEDFRGQVLGATDPSGKYSLCSCRKGREEYDMK